MIIEFVRVRACCHLCQFHLICWQTRNWQKFNCRFATDFMNFSRHSCAKYCVKTTATSVNLVADLDRNRCKLKKTFFVTNHTIILNKALDCRNGVAAVVTQWYMGVRTEPPSGMFSLIMQRTLLLRMETEFCPWQYYLTKIAVQPHLLEMCSYQGPTTWAF